MPLNLRQFVKECILEVLMENLTEGYDPQSQGPNIPEENPYPQWNSQMRTLEEDGGALELTPTGQEDDWSRPVYQDKEGNVYVDINLGQGEPSIHTVTNDGEPLSPVRNYTIVGGGSQDRHANALCPRCKNSKPELMKQTADGKMSCTYCHWVDNEGEPYKITEEHGEPELYTQYGVTYGHLDKGKKCPPDMKEFTYTLRHIPTGEEFPRKVCCYNSNDFYKLMRMWSLTSTWETNPDDASL